MSDSACRVGKEVTGGYRRCAREGGRQGWDTGVPEMAAAYRTGE